MDDLLLGYVLDALDPAETAAVEAHLRDHPGDAAKVAKLRRLVRPLAADRAGYDPPPGLAVDTLAYVAARVVARRHGEPDAGGEPPAATPSSAWPRAAADAPVFAGRRRFDAAIAAGIAILAVGLVLSGAQKFRRDAQRVACQNNFRVLYQGLTDYADTHHGDFPRVGGPDAPTAGSFAAVLAESGQFPAGLRLTCPAAADAAPEVVAYRPDPSAPPGPGVLAGVGFVYTLGYRGPNNVLVGLRRAADGSATDQTPLAADLPAGPVSPAAGPMSPHGKGQNVLFADGRVQFSTTATVGPGGDDIYRNDAGWVRAGLHRNDASLGRATDVP